MSLKQINFPIKLNFFKKLFLLTIGIVFLTIITSFIFNSFFLDKFYIYRKKQSIIEIRNNIVKLMDNKDELKNYIYFAEDNFGVKIDLNLRPHMNSTKKIYNSLKINDSTFKIGEIDGTSGVMFIRYYEKLNNGYMLSIRSSMAVIAKHIHDIFIFNIFTAFFSLFIGGLLVSLFSKKINKNIMYLKNSAKKIAKLEYPDKISLNSGDELEELATSLNEMSKELAFAIENLKLFVSNASHELKTPISVLCLYSQALARDTVPIDKRKEYYKTMLDKSLEMRSLTESLLTLSKINSPDYKILSQEIDISSLIEISLEQFDYIEFEKNINVVTNISTSYILGDYNLLKIAINNLVQNMLKYSPEDSTVDISLKNNLLIFKNLTTKTITKNFNELFEPFQRGENALNENVEGSGLGLSLVKRILELHNLHFTLDIKNNYFIFKILIKKTD
ncbi:HAMP domain-containing histidine kinase [Cetobacterium somerae]|uniref:HAMP domain-containing sensor histidine kinase n=1 Tax=Cetobacterium sp. NK01 TaxID=2993530 RepID=UPI002116D5BD|nr:HAMP domain-containing sensor histidine kinase [Cetobacterium sp. NK01]MCQ8212472.1 HAMP domain-containing histidine kinase [Cetobacterium sp. NK01]